MKSIAAIAIILICCISLNAQSISVSNLAIDDSGQISFNYSISKHHSDREAYQLEVYSSADNFRSPIQLTIPPVQVGQTKKVFFEGPKVIGDYKGSLKFQFKIKAVTFPVQITTTESKFKSGKNITISWDDFHQSGLYNVELYKGGFISKTLASRYRGTLFTGNLPKKMEKGTYEVRVTPTNQEELYSEDFPVTIRPASPMLLILGGGALAGAGVLVLAGGGGDAAGGGGRTGLPDPPDPNN